MLPDDIVLDNGDLNGVHVWKREKLYRGLNGRFVERFYLNAGESYIFKPLTNDTQFGKEVWVHRKILSQFPSIYPKIISCSTTRKPEISWMIVEDLGPLSHDFNEDSVIRLAKIMAWWHSLPIGPFLDIPRAGQKPRFEDIAADIRLNKDGLLQQLPLAGIEGDDIHRFFFIIDSFIFSKKQVLSHGDLHLGNFAVVGERLVVLDWEHAHLNSPFWDLFHLLDLSHPLFPKKITREFRDQVLSLYLDEVEFEVADPDAFMYEYHLYSAVFSMWMVWLIQQDLAADDRKWPRERLENQLEETTAVLKQCLERLF
ncbi:phosphotransferase family protein [Neobacillus muris]|uniref:phosphotransferase family protein n=1 Tax=Neobacillus muris TaxID=2941334 RepID=UPI00203F7C1E|nr:phosphotransferase [Neobacillus muris]